MSPKIKNLLTRTLTGALYVTLMVLSIYNHWVMAVLFLLVIGVGMHEAANLHPQPTDLFTRISWIVTGCLLFLDAVVPAFITQELSSPIFTVCIILPLGVFLFFILSDILRFKHLAASAIFNLCWIVGPLILMAYAAHFAPTVALSFLLLIWASDTFAYLGGSLLGKHKLCERISPGKTWEGFLISFVLTIGLAIAMSYIPYLNTNVFHGSILGWTCFAAIVVVFGLFGDLFESMLKRKAGVKDSGKLIPGHGGVLDRFDSIFIAAYPAFLFALLFLI